MKLMVIDGNSLINRAFYGIRPLTTRDGTPTQAVFGFLAILDRLLSEENPDALCAAFDRKEPTFRHEAFEAYKAQRKPMPDDLARQLPILREVLSAMNIPCYELAGWEADDLIGTIATRCAKENWDCVVATGDKDSLQLLGERVTVDLISTRMGQSTTKRMTPALFEEEYGFPPRGIIDLKALMGDASDNIPGVPGVGEKTAMDLMHRCASIRQLYDGLDTLDLKPAVLKRLTEGRHMAFLSYDLATIRTDAPIAFAPADAMRKPPSDALYDLFKRLEFLKLIDKYNLKPAGGPAAAAQGAGNPAVSRVETPEALASLLETWKKGPVSVFCLGNLEAAAVCDGKTTQLLSRQTLGEAFDAALPALFGPGVQKYAHDLKDLIVLLLGEGLPADGFVLDTALAAYLLDATAAGFSLERLSVAYLGEELPPKADLFDYSPLGGAEAAETAAAARAAAVWRMAPLLSAALAEKGMTALFDDIELPLCRVLAEMELSGCKVDRAALGAFGETLSGRIDETQRRIYEMAGGAFNINSTQQLGALLFETFGLPHGKKTKTGWSTNIDVLEKLRGEHPVIEAVMEYRKLTKLKSTYVDGLSKVIAPDGRIHTRFMMTVTATGRLSSAEPNLQNIPTRTDLGREMRRMFIPEKGCVLVDADYSQIELRILAHIADDAAMRQAFLDGVDIHAVTASQVFGVPLSEVTPKMRSSSKAVNFGIVYGISEFSLAQDIGVSRREAKQYIDNYLAHYAGVRAYMRDIVERARRDGYVSTLYGRRRALPELKSSNYNTRSFGERVALNMPIQGTAADIMKLAMVRVHARLRADGLKAQLILQVHDELIAECPEGEAKRVAEILTAEMEGAAKLSVPLEAAAAIGKSWYEAK